VPDAKTVWLYREGLAQAGMVDALFKQFDGYLARQGYIARGGQILDGEPLERRRPLGLNQWRHNGQLRETMANDRAGAAQSQHARGEQDDQGR